jgi:serine/threonine protein kinase
LNLSDTNRLIKTLAILNGDSCNHVTSFEIVTIRGGKTINFMPLYPSTLEQLPMITFEICTDLCIQMFTAFEFLHKHELAHMDIKPANICISTEGNFVLIDLESTAKFGEFTFSTDKYLPLGLGFNGMNMISDKRVDFIMLAISLYAMLNKSFERVSYDFIAEHFLTGESRFMEPELIKILKDNVKF